MGANGAAALADSAPVLRFDPFRPRPQDVAIGAADASTAQLGFEPVLRSIVLSPVRSMVNLGGEILFPGEEAHGYRLVEVHAFEALFIKEGREVRLELSTATGGEL